MDDFQRLAERWQRASRGVVSTPQRAGISPTMFDSNRRVAEALDVPTLALELWIYLGFVPLAVGGMAQIGWLGYIAMAVGLGLVLIGIRAAMKAPRPFDAGVPAMSRLVPTTRAVGWFYALAGTVWILISFGVAQSG